MPWKHLLDSPPPKKVWLSVSPWPGALPHALHFLWPGLEPQTFTEVLSFSGDTQHSILHQGTLTFLLFSLPPFLGWICWIPLWLAPSGCMCPLSALHSHYFQPNVSAVWGCACSPISWCPCQSLFSFVVSQMSEFEHWNWRSKVQPGPLPPWSHGVRMQLCPLVPVRWNSSTCMTEHFHSVSSDLGQV